MAVLRLTHIYLKSECSVKQKKKKEFQSKLLVLFYTSSDFAPVFPLDIHVHQLPATTTTAENQIFRDDR